MQNNFKQILILSAVIILLIFPTIFNFAFNLFLTILLTRIIVPNTGQMYFNPTYQKIIKITNPIVKLLMKQNIKSEKKTLIIIFIATFLLKEILSIVLFQNYFFFDNIFAVGIDNFIIFQISFSFFICILSIISIKANISNHTTNFFITYSNNLAKIIPYKKSDDIYLNSKAIFLKIFFLNYILLTFFILIFFRQYYHQSFLIIIKPMYILLKILINVVEYIFLVSIILKSLFSWFLFIPWKNYPAMEIIESTANIILSKLNRFNLTIGNIDFTPFVAIFGIMIISSFAEQTMKYIFFLFEK